jgi:hypothetical protein
MSDTEKRGHSFDLVGVLAPWDDIEVWRCSYCGCLTAGVESRDIHRAWHREVEGV